MSRQTILILGGVAATGAVLIWAYGKYSRLRQLGALLTIKPYIAGGIDFKQQGKLVSGSTILAKVVNFAAGVVQGYFTVPLGIELQNRTAEQLSVQLHSLQLRYKGSRVADLAPNAQVITIAGNAKTRTVFTLEIPATGVFSTLKEVLTSKDGYKHLAENSELKISLTANGVSVDITEPLVESPAALTTTPVSGLGLTASGKRTIRSKREYLHLIDSLGALSYSDPIVEPNGSVDTTVALMHRIVAEHHRDTAKLAQKLKAASLRDTLRNIWNFVYTYIQYVPDSKLFEQLRRPLRTLHDQKGDCDCYAILIGSMLTNLGIPYKFRVAEYDNRGFFQHVYVVVPSGGSCITVDPVVDKFDYEKPYTKKKDFSK